MATSPSLYRSLPYDPLTAFAPIGLVTEVPMTLVARPDFPPEDLQGLIDYVKENADEVTYAHAGIGAASQLCGMLFMQAIETPVVTVPYKGTGPAMTDLMGGQVDFMCDQTTNTTNQIKAGTIKAYAVFTDERLDALPDVPTAKEAGLEIPIAIWHGLYAPAGTPDEVIAELSDALQKALADPKVVERFAELGTAPVPPEAATPSALQEKLASEIDRWEPVIKAAGVYAE
jgi:putative tricarboxylic transport membrane protein